MTLTASLLVTGLVSIFLLYVVTLIKHDKLAIRYALYWVILAVALLIITWFPTLLHDLSALLGIYSETNMVFFVGFCLSLWLIFWLTNTVSQQATKIRRLTQKLALLEKQMEER